MKSFFKSLTKAALKISFAVVIISVVPASMLLALEYISPKLNIFPLYTFTGISIFWLGLFSIPFLLTQIRNFHSPVLKGVPAANLKSYLEAVRNFPAGIFGLVRKYSDKFSFSKSKTQKAARIKLSSPFPPKSGGIEPLGIFLIINDEVVKTKASAANLSAK